VRGHVTILDMKDSATAARAKELGIHSVPAVVIDGKLSSCCSSRGVEEGALRAEGVGSAIA
jgi:hypothetical protein